MSILGKVGGVHVPDRTTMREVHARLRVCDAWLLPMEQASLLAPELWPWRRHLGALAVSDFG
ncbi:hypothetical protein [Rhodococcus koreensis]|uniref:hypothetical protein n=1 Tax=Rhodococcus koreensis TaxID=99653 RepID=UPI00366BCD16